MTWIGIGSFLYKKYPISPLSTEGCMNYTSDFGNHSRTLYNFTTSIETLHNSTASVEPANNSFTIFPLYDLAFIWFNVLGPGIVIVVGLIVSFVTGYTDPKSVDARYICPIFDVLCPYLPEKIRKPLRFGIVHKHKFEIQDTFSKMITEPQNIMLNVDDKNDEREEEILLPVNPGEKDLYVCAPFYATIAKKINSKRKKTGLWLHAPNRAKVTFISEENQTTPDTESRQLTSDIIVKAPIKRQNCAAWNTKGRVFPPTYEENILDEILCKVGWPSNSNKGLYDPQTTKINFAVPNINSINNFDLVETNIPREMYPVVIAQALKFMPRDKNYVLSVDGKKLAPGLTNIHGDQDLFGHEEGNSLQDLKDRLESEIQEVETVKHDWNKMNDTDKKDKLISIVSIVSIRIKELRLLFQNQSFALRRFHKEAGDDWRTSRYVYAISSVQAVIYQIKSIVRRLLKTNNMIFEFVARINNSNTEDLPEGLLSDTRYVKQRSQEWFEKRKQFRLTGSKLFEGLGLDSLENLQKHYDKVIRKKNLEETFPNEVQEKMDHGTKSEIHAIATLATQILPVYYQSMSYIEEGAFIIHNNE
ncbi:SLC5A6 [Mytilus coruscus]|uniref:SLC5A6 n=1 Tax=Mytilus coruscus TaxID=42192 RepID=A0A6J8AT05_MYTCO|nr:SLC5A6 [Mytilus coruscus]